MERKITVSVIENIPEIRERIERTIHTAPDFVCIPLFENGESAQKKLPPLCPDIVLTDISLPGMSGFECVRMLKEKCPQTQFVLFTIYGPDNEMFEVQSVDGNGYVLKKMAVESVLSTVRGRCECKTSGNFRLTSKAPDKFHDFESEMLTMAALSAREKEVVQLLSKGFLYKEIADKLFISTGTVRQHIHHIYKKLHVQNRTEALNTYFAGSYKRDGL